MNAATVKPVSAPMTIARTRKIWFADWRSPATRLNSKVIHRVRLVIGRLSRFSSIFAAKLHDRILAGLRRKAQGRQGAQNPAHTPADSSCANCRKRRVARQHPVLQSAGTNRREANAGRRKTQHRLRARGRVPTNRGGLKTFLKKGKTSGSIDAQAARSRRSPAGGRSDSRGSLRIVSDWQRIQTQSPATAPRSPRQQMD